MPTSDASGCALPYGYSESSKFALASDLAGFRSTAETIMNLPVDTTASDQKQLVIEKTQITLGGRSVGRPRSDHAAFCGLRSRPPSAQKRGDQGEQDLQCLL